MADLVPLGGDHSPAEAARIRELVGSIEAQVHHGLVDDVLERARAAAAQGDAVAAQLVARLLEDDPLEAICWTWHDQVPPDSFCAVCHWAPALDPGGDGAG